MSSFGLGGGGYRSPNDDMQLKAAKMEVELVQDLFNRMSDLCFRKCINNKFKENELNLGEQSCTDRCVAKYMATQKTISETFQEFSAAEQQRMQQQGMMPPGGAQ